MDLFANFPCEYHKLVAQQNGSAPQKSIEYAKGFLFNPIFLLLLAAFVCGPICNQCLHTLDGFATPKMVSFIVVLVVVVVVLVVVVVVVVESSKQEGRARENQT
jgi:hypothetical protein